MAFCQNCGNSIENKARFCPSCGTPNVLTTSGKDEVKTEPVSDSRPGTIGGEAGTYGLNELPLDGIIGEIVNFEGKLYVWKGEVK